MSLILEYQSAEVPIFTIPPNWGDGGLLLRMLDNVLVLESLDTSEERIQTRPRPLYGIQYRPLTLTDQETGYMRRTIELPDAMPFAMPLWQDAVKLTAGITPGATSLSVESTADSLWDTFTDLALVWSAFNSWELVSVSGVATNTITLDIAAVGTWPVGALLIPVAFGQLKRTEATNITSDHARLSIEFEERYFHVTITETTATVSSTPCCQTTPFFTPAYSPFSDRLGVGSIDARTSGYAGAVAKLYSPTCTGVATFNNTRITGGGTYVAAVEAFYFGCQGGSGGAFGNKLAVVMDVAGAVVSYVSGFPNPTGTARGLNAQYISASGGKVWMQVKDCGGNNAFAVIDPSDNSIAMVADATLATCFENAWVYCPIDGCIYCLCAGEVLAKIEVITLEVTIISLVDIGAVTLVLNSITYTDATPSNPGSGMIWLGYTDTGVTPNHSAIVVLDVSGVSPVIVNTIITTAPQVELWYAFDLDIVFATGEASGTFDTYKSDYEKSTVHGYSLIGAQGVLIDSLSQTCIPTYHAGQYCLTYFTSSDSGLVASSGRITQDGSPRITQDGGRRLLQL